MSAQRGVLRQFFVPGPLLVGQTVVLPAPLTHRLTKVLRLQDGDEVALLDNATGRYTSTLQNKGRNAKIQKQTDKLTPPTPLTLWLALPKKDALESALRQATELGITHIQPLTSAYSQVARLNQSRAENQLVEAAEQSERLTVPKLLPLMSLEDALERLTQPLWWASEIATPGTRPSQAASLVLVGPEGGFAPAEIAALKAHKNVHPLSLGHTILRTDTAVVAALTLARH